MYLGQHSPFCSGLKYAVGLFWGKEAFVAEHVYIVGKMLAPYLWYHLLYNKTYIFVLGVLASYCMRTKKVDTTFIGAVSFMRLITRSIFSSSSVLRP